MDRDPRAVDHADGVLAGENAVVGDLDIGERSPACCPPPEIAVPPSVTMSMRSSATSTESTTWKIGSVAVSLRGTTRVLLRQPWMRTLPAPVDHRVGLMQARQQADLAARRRQRLHRRLDRIEVAVAAHAVADEVKVQQPPLFLGNGWNTWRQSSMSFARRGRACVPGNDGQRHAAMHGRPAAVPWSATARDRTASRRRAPGRSSSHRACSWCCRNRAPRRRGGCRSPEGSD